MMASRKPKPCSDVAALALRMKEQEPEFSFAIGGEPLFTTDWVCLVIWGYAGEVPADPEAPATRLYLYRCFDDTAALPYLLVTVEPDGLTMRNLDVVSALAAMKRIAAAWTAAAKAQKERRP